MGIFGNSSPFDEDVDKATSENNTSEQWGLILEICDRAASSATAAKDCLRAIMRRLAHQDPHVAVQAVVLLDACVNNCGKPFLLEIASRDFENEFRRILSRAQPAVQNRLRGALKRWAEGEFRTDPQLDLVPSLYAKLRQEGHDFNISEPERETRAPPASYGANNPNNSAAAAAVREQEELARAIALSLQDSTVTSGGGSASTGASLYPSMDTLSMGASQSASTATTTPAAAATAHQQVRALYDFEAAEDNELTFLAGEIIHVTDSTDPNWWKGYNKRGEGLFPANFVSNELTAATPAKNVQFTEAEVREEEAPLEPEPRINEPAMDAALQALHDADPEDPTAETPAMRQQENAVYAMGPLIDAELQRADRRHATLTQLSADLVDAMNLYHSLMREPLKAPPSTIPSMPPPQLPGMQHPAHQTLPSHPSLPGHPQMFPAGVYFPPPSHNHQPPHY